MAILGLFKMTAAFHSVRQISPVALPPLRFPGENVAGFEKALGAVKVIKDQIQHRPQSLLNLARDYFR